jgi:hypothetical protein
MDCCFKMLISRQFICASLNYSSLCIIGVEIYKRTWKFMSECRIIYRYQWKKQGCDIVWQIMAQNSICLHWNRLLSFFLKNHFWSFFDFSLTYCGWRDIFDFFSFVFKKNIFASSTGHFLYFISGHPLIIKHYFWWVF